MVADPDAMQKMRRLPLRKYASAEVSKCPFSSRGTPLLRDGNFFQRPNITIEVAQE